MFKISVIHSNQYQLILMNVLNWFLDEDKKQEQPIVRFTPRIVVSPHSTLHVEVQPKDPTTTANIVITAFASRQVRSIIPIRVEWSRFKLNNNNPHSTQKIHCLVGSTYMCEPSDVGGYVRANIRSADESIRAEAEVTIGPIGIDPMIKRLLDGALYSGNLLSQVVVCERERKCNVTLRLYNRTMEFMEDNTQNKLVKDYTMSQPKIELNPKDPTRVYVRFEHDQENIVRQWLNTVFGVRNTSIDESGMSVRVPYSTHSSNSSKMRLFQKSHGPCPNKMQLRFLSRHSRDLFLFTQRAFICRQDMRNSVYIHRIETLQTINNDADYFKFLQFMSLKYQIWRLGEYAKEIEDDRDAKVKDLVNMQESIAEMTLTYLKIIQQKAKHSNLDLQQSYSQINNTREDVIQRRNLRELRTQNQNLKQRLREMNEQLELQKFFKQQDNASIMFDHTTNPFAKKTLELSMSYQAQSPQAKASQRNNMYEMSINYANLIEENRVLKSENKKYKSAMGRQKLERSQNMIEILGSLDERDDKQAKITELQKTISQLLKQKQQMQRTIQQLREQNMNKSKINTPYRFNTSFNNEPSGIISRSVLNQSLNSGVTDSFLNQSITSDVAIMKLQENLKNLSSMNTKLTEDNTRLRRERDHYRNQTNQLKTIIRELEQTKQNRSNFIQDSMVMRSREDYEQLQNEKNALQKKLDSLVREGAGVMREDVVRKDKMILELESEVEKARKEKAQLLRQVEGMMDGGSNEELQMYQNQNLKLKKINGQLLQQIKTLKMALQKKSDDNMYNSRVIELQNELAFAMSSSSNGPTQHQQYLQQINQLTKQVARLKQDNSDKNTKLQHQAVTIDKLVVQNRKIQHQSPSKPNSSSLSSTNSKEKCYSERCSQATVQQLEKYKRQVKKLQQEIIFMKKSSDAINRSRDLTMEMDGYYQEKIDIMRREIDQLCLQNQNLSKMCERYGKDAKQANREVNQWREKYQQLLRARTEESSLISN